MLQAEINSVIDSTLRMRITVIKGLKGSKKRKDELKKADPDLFVYFNKVWTVRKNHMLEGYPPQYLFILKCCFKEGCPHPLCVRGPPDVHTWFPGGPNLGYIPLPVPDPARSWGSLNCEKCKGFCAGHFLNPEAAFSSRTSAMIQPPSASLKEFHSSLKGAVPEPSQLEVIARKTMLPVCEVNIWLDHLTMIANNRKRGAAKAAQTRRQRRLAKEQERKEETVCYCGACGGQYEEETNDVEFWICCDRCDLWFHGICVGVDASNSPDIFKCSSCESL